MAYQKASQVILGLSQYMIRPFTFLTCLALLTLLACSRPLHQPVSASQAFMLTLSEQPAYNAEVSFPLSVEATSSSTRSLQSQRASASGGTALYPSSQSEIWQLPGAFRMLDLPLPKAASPRLTWKTRLVQKIVNRQLRKAVTAQRQEGAKTDGLAIASPASIAFGYLVAIAFQSSFGALLWLISTVASIVFGFMALSNIKKSEGKLKGKGWATTGLILGFTSVLLVIIVAIALASTCWLCGLNW
jgi:hypothetical protein